MFKFDTVVHYGPEVWRLGIVKIHFRSNTRWRTALKLDTFKIANSAADCSISLKVDMIWDGCILVHVGFGIVEFVGLCITDLVKRRTASATSGSLMLQRFAIATVFSYLYSLHCLAWHCRLVVNSTELTVLIISNVKSVNVSSCWLLFYFFK